MSRGVHRAPLNPAACLTAPLLALVVALLTACAPHPHHPSMDRRAAAEINRYFARLDRGDRPGAALLIQHRGDILLEGYHGRARLDPLIPVSADTRFNVGSVAKQFVGYLARREALQGTLDLDQPVRHYLADMPAFEPPITLRHLLHHTSGLRDGFQLLVMAGQGPGEVADDQSLLQILRGQRSLNHGPGAEYSYTNSGYTLLAEILQVVTGRSLPELAQREIFQPLGMHDSYFLSPTTPGDPALALSYARGSGGDGWRLSPTDSVAAGAGGLITTARDLGKWFDHLVHLHDSGDPLWQALLEPGLLDSGEVAISRRGETYGAGLLIGELRGLTYVGHGGAVARYQAGAFLLPASGTSVIVLLNGPWEQAYPLSLALAERVLPGLGAELADRPRSRPPYQGRIARRLVRDAAGLYVTPQPFPGANLPAHIGIALVARDDGLGVAVLGDQLEIAEPLSAREFHTRQWSSMHLRLTPRSGATPLVEADFGEGFVQLARGGCEMDNASREALAGRYWSDELRTAYQLTAGDGRMEVSHPRQGEAWLLCLTEDQFLAAGAPTDVPWGFTQLEVARDPSGAVDGIYLTSGERTRRVFFAREATPP